jgi:hypothetical protein
MGSRNLGWILIALAVLLLWVSGRIDWLVILFPVAMVVMLVIGRSKRAAVRLPHDVKRGRLA